MAKQTERAAEIHTRHLLPGKATCIDCHKGIARELPNMEGVDRRGWISSGLSLCYFERMVRQGENKLRYPDAVFTAR